MCIGTSDVLHRCDASFHHVVHVEYFVPRAGGDDGVAVATEASLVNGEAVQVDALDFTVGLAVHLRRRGTRMHGTSCYIVTSFTCLLTIDDGTIWLRHRENYGPIFS